MINRNLLSFAIILLMFSLSYAQRDWDEIEIKSTQIADSLFMLEGSGGNMVVLVHAKGTVLIDDQFAQLSDKIKKQIKALGSDQIAYLVNTHFHGDHTGGNENFAADGSLIIAHENVRKRLSTEQVNKAFNRTTPAKPEASWPVITYDANMKLHIGSEDIHIMHVHNAHTDGDSFVYFATSNVLHMGDCYFNQRFPYIDLGSGGSIKGAIQAVRKALFVSNHKTVIVPGHGGLSNKEELAGYLEMLLTMLSRVEEGIAAGKSLDELKAAGLNEGYESWGEYFISSDKFIDTIWTDLNRE